MKEEQDILEIETSDDVGKFVESYSSFNKIINKLQRQYISLKETYTLQSDELQSVNKALQSTMIENRAVTEFLNSILNSLSSGVLAVDSKGIVTHMNPAARKILGADEIDFREAELHYDKVMSHESDTNYSAVKTLADGTEIENCEKKVRTGHDTVINLSISTSLLKNRGGEVIGAVELFHDISKLRKMEQQISQMKVLASLGEMAASIAHEVRNPLNGIGGFASLLARDLEKDEAKRNMARKIVEGVESINHTIQTLLDFARREKVEKTSVDLNTYLKNLLDSFSDEYAMNEASERLKQDFQLGHSIQIDLDRQLFKQAICNLVKNGLEADDGTARVTVSTLIQPLADAHKKYGDSLGLAGTETLAEIIIEDNGPGIDNDACRKMFSPFYSTKENGIGLGLSIAWKIVKAHGGDLSVTSELGGGTRFSIVLPMTIS